MWFFLALTSTFFYSFRRFSEKTLSHKADHFTLGWAVQAFSLPGITLLLFFTTIPNLSSLSANFWVPLLIIWIILYPLQAHFYYKSLKEGDITYVLPLLSTIPIFNVFISFFLVHELPSFVGFLGIFAIVAGVYSLNMKPKMNPFRPFTHLIHDKPSFFMIINCACLAFGSTLDKIAIQASNPLFYSFINTLGATIILLIITRVTNPTFHISVKNNYKAFSILGILQAIGFTTYITALSTGIVPYVVAIKSTSAVLASVLGFIFLKEALNKYKVLALSFILLGLLLIGIG